MMIPAQGYGGKCGKYIKITGVSLRSFGGSARQDMGFCCLVNILDLGVVDVLLGAGNL